MHISFIPLFNNIKNIKILKEEIRNLKSDYELFYTIQFQQYAEKIAKELKIKTSKTLHSNYPGHYVGCDFLQIKSGIVFLENIFHAINIIHSFVNSILRDFLNNQINNQDLMKERKLVIFEIGESINEIKLSPKISQKLLFEKERINNVVDFSCSLFFDIYKKLIINIKKQKPKESSKIISKFYYEIDLKDLINSFEKRIKQILNLLLNSKNIGIIISIKKGQMNLRMSEKVKKAIEGLINKHKIEMHIFTFIANEIKMVNLSSYPIDFWINTACPRVVDDFYEERYFKIVNAMDILLMMKKYKLGENA